MTFEEACSYIDETPKFTQKHSLDHTRECLRRLGNPERAFSVIHVAGTNGKGSVCAFLESVLRTAGYRTGLFTSPHLVDIRERFMIGGEMISEEEFLAAFDTVRELSLDMEKEGEGHPTYFEMLFLMGMLIFKERHAEVVVLETGLGGRLDATTAVPCPLACVITSISLDHVQYLGNTVEQIAAEKAGIIVPEVPVIYDANDQRAAEVIKNTAGLVGSRAVPVNVSDTVVKKKNRAGIDFSFNNDYYDKNTVFHIPFIADYQVMNAALAVKTLEVMTGCGQISVTREDIIRGIADTSWPGRMETVLPGVVLDGAHNEDGIRKFAETAEYFTGEYPICLLFGAVNDKDYPDMIGLIAGKIHPESVVTTQIGGAREVPAEELAEVFREKGCANVTAEPDPKKAFGLALQKKPEDGLLFCVGSLYLVGEIKKEVASLNDRL